jgi:phage shock protein PspC (stress-responsive transcriptional regulator)
MGIAEQLGADPSLTAVAVVLTGIMGAIIVTPLMNRAGITDFRARGFAAGIAAHGIGTARAFQVDAVAGVFAGIAMSLNALVTSFLVPLAVTFLIRGLLLQCSFVLPPWRHPEISARLTPCKRVSHLDLHDNAGRARPRLRGAGRLFARPDRRRRLDPGGPVDGLCGRRA